MDQSESNFRLLTIAGVINLDPKKHVQRQWACGTARCVGGWAVDLFAELDLFQGDFGDFYVPSDTSLDKGFLQGDYYGRRAVKRLNAKGEDVIVLAFSKGEAYPGEVVYQEGEPTYRALNTYRLAQAVLGLSEDDATALFNAENTLEEVNAIILAIVNGEEYTCGAGCECTRCKEERHSYEEGDYYDGEYDSDADYEDSF